MALGYSNILTGPGVVRLEEKAVGKIRRKEKHEEINESEWLYAATTNPSFDFLKAPEEDIYTLEDGMPFDGDSMINKGSLSET